MGVMKVKEMGRELQAHGAAAVLDVQRRRNAVVVEHWPGMQRMFDSWKKNIVQTVREGVEQMNEPGLLWFHSGRRNGPVMFASMSSSGAEFGGGSRGGFRRRRLEGGGGAGQGDAYMPRPGTYAYESLQRKFKELDQDGSGYITGGALREALKSLNLPASEQDIQDFVKGIKSTTPTGLISFHQYAEYCVQKENDLFATFKELDRKNIGYISEDGVKAALQKYRFRIKDKDLSNLIDRKGGSSQFSGKGRGYDFDEFKGILLSQTRMDLSDVRGTWGPSVIDLGDVDLSLPLSVGKEDVFSQSKGEVYKHLVAGGLAGALARTVVAPLERVKIMAMVDKKVAQAGAGNALKNIWREEGVGGLFRGNTLNIIRLVPAKAAEFLVYDKVKKVILKKTDREDLNGSERIVLGSLVSISGAIASHPFETVRSIISTQSPGAKKGIREVTRVILEKRNWNGLFEGLGPHVARAIPYGVVNFLVYDKLKEWYKKENGPGANIEALPTIVFGATAGAFAQTVVYPLELVQRRLQVQATMHGPIVYENMVQAIQNVIREEGFSALYAGLAPTYLKLIPAAAVSFLAYEAIKKELAR